jgi:hypothetical protein
MAKVYGTMSARRTMSDLREAHERGYISKLPCHNSVLNALESADLTPILRDLIAESSAPLKAVEIDFAVDSSGFTTCRFESWYDHKYGAPRRQHSWVKAHIMCGVKTNVVTAVEIAGRDTNDGTQLPALVNATARTFPIAEVSADKAYGTIRNADTIAGPRRNAVHRLQDRPHGRRHQAASRWARQRCLVQDVRVFHVQARRIPDALPQAVERGDNLLDDQAEVRRLAPQQDRHRADQ